MVFVSAASERQVVLSRRRFEAVAGFVLIRIANCEIANDVQDRSDVSVTSDDDDEIFVLMKAQAVGSSASLKKKKDI